MIATNKDSTINVVFAGNGKAIKEIAYNAGEFDSFNIFDANNTRSIKIFKLAKFKNLIKLKKLKTEFFTLKAISIFTKLK